MASPTPWQDWQDSTKRSRSIQDNNIRDKPLPSHRPASHHRHPPAQVPPNAAPGQTVAAPTALALRHQDIAKAVVGPNLSCRAGHPREDMEQIVRVVIILAARRYVPERGGFRPYARRYANGEVHHFLLDQGFLIKLPPSWRELHARGKKLEAEGVASGAVAQRLGLD